MESLSIKQRIRLIVPSLELCKQIPAGEFTETVFFWHVDQYGSKKIRINTQDMKNEVKQYKDEKEYPAPTLEEIVTDLGSFENCDYCEDHIIIGTDCYYYPSEAEQALALWLEIRKKHKRLIGGAW